MIDYIALLIALCLSGVSGFYSIVGLTAIFSSAFWPIVFMGTVLELGKLTTASWLYNNWSITPILLRYYLAFTVIVLMFITSMGSFGFLSKAHIEQTINIGTNDSGQIEILQNKIDNEKSKISNIDIQVKQIDDAIASLTAQNKAATSVVVATQQRKTRDELVSRKDEYVKNISVFNTERIKLSTNTKRLEAEIGPLKYIAQLIYGSDANSEQLEKAVRFVIIIIVAVFDPLAVLLLIAANIGMKNNRKEKLISPHHSDIMTIDL
jgi:hypothetical protein